ncbi:MAG: DNA polymerase III subunit gamma/tau [Oscillospiraceae bacterium]
MYLALYRKWRPARFCDVVSQEHVTTTLKNQLMQDKTAHAYLFTGSRGTGKTSCAKIFAKAVNCLNPKDGEPCLECEACRGIENGSVTDVVEIDAASNSGVDDIRELRERAFFTPAFAKYRVYIIDEVHMLSTSAFNALLKIMEEPPAHVKFILATTEAHEVPITILSRCQRFDFGRIKAEDIAKRLNLIASKENVKLSEEASALIARLADGGMRDAISLLDQTLAATDDVTVEAVTKAIGIAGSDYLFALADCIADNNSAKALQIIDELYMKAKDLQRLCGELVNHFRNLMILKAMPDADELTHALPDELIRLKEQKERFSMDKLLHCISILQESNDKINKTSGKRIEFEMCMIKLCSGDNGSDFIKADTVQPIKKPQAIPSLRNETEKSPEEKPNVGKETPIEEIPAPNPPKENPIHEEKPVEKQNKPVQSSAPASFERLSEWSKIVAETASSAPYLQGALMGTVAFRNGDSLYIDSQSPMLTALLKRDGNLSYLRAAVRSVLGTDLKIKLRSSASRTETSEQNEPVNELINTAKNLGIKVDIE